MVMSSIPTPVMVQFWNLRNFIYPDLSQYIRLQMSANMGHCWEHAWGIALPFVLQASEWTKIPDSWLRIASRDALPTARVRLSNVRTLSLWWRRTSPTRRLPSMHCSCGKKPRQSTGSEGKEAWVSGSASGVYNLASKGIFCQCCCCPHSCYSSHFHFLGLRLVLCQLAVWLFFSNCCLLSFSLHLPFSGLSSGNPPVSAVVFLIFCNLFLLYFRQSLVFRSDNPANFISLLTILPTMQASVLTSSLRSFILLLSTVFTPAVLLNQLFSHTCSLHSCLSDRATVSRPYDRNQGSSLSTFWKSF